jgi:hypothetical protein
MERAEQRIWLTRAMNSIEAALLRTDRPCSTGRNSNRQRHSCSVNGHSAGLHRCPTPLLRPSQPAGRCWQYSMSGRSGELRQSLFFCVRIHSMSGPLDCLIPMSLVLPLTHPPSAMVYGEARWKNGDGQQPKHHASGSAFVPGPAHSVSCSGLVCFWTTPRWGTRPRSQRQTPLDGRPFDDGVSGGRSARPTVKIWRPQTQGEACARPGTAGNERTCCPMHLVLGPRHPFPKNTHDRESQEQRALPRMKGFR